MPRDDVFLSQLPLKFLFSSSWSFKMKNRHYSSHNGASTFHAHFSQFFWPCSVPFTYGHHVQFRFPPTRPNISSHTTANTAPIDAATTTIPPTTTALPPNADVWLVVAFHPPLLDDLCGLSFRRSSSSPHTSLSSPHTTNSASAPSPPFSQHPHLSTRDPKR